MGCVVFDVNSIVFFYFIFLNVSIFFFTKSLFLREKRKEKKGKKIKVSPEEKFSFCPIGYFESPFSKLNSTPRQSIVMGKSNSIPGRIRIVGFQTSFANIDSLENLENFSHIWIIWVFHKNKKKSDSKPKVKPPRLGGKKTGVFACRSPYRINPIGLSLVKIHKIEKNVIDVIGADLVNGTPILDIKPFIPLSDTPPLAEITKVPEWVVKEDEKRSVQSVFFSEKSLNNLRKIQSEGKLKFFDKTDEEHVLKCLRNILMFDPRSNYRKDKCLDDPYIFHFDNLQITCKNIDINTIKVKKVNFCEFGKD